ncbi:TfoX/Sxy family protein [soil metagenome]
MGVEPLSTDVLSRIRLILGETTAFRETRVIGGGTGFMVDGRLCFGVPQGMTVRIDPDQRHDLLSEPHVVPLEFGRKQPHRFLVVKKPGFETEADLRRWVARCLDAPGT